MDIHDVGVALRRGVACGGCVAYGRSEWRRGLRVGAWLMEGRGLWGSNGGVTCGRGVAYGGVNRGGVAYGGGVA